MLINGGVRGYYNAPTAAAASGSWTRNDHYVYRLRGNWPVPAAQQAFVAVPLQTTPYINVYQFTSRVGFGSKMSDPGVPPGSYATKVAWAPDNSAIFVSTAAAPYIAAWSWSAAGFGTRYTNPSSLISFASYSVAVNPTSSYVALQAQSATSSSSYIYPWSIASGFGTATAIPVGSSTGYGYATKIAWSPTNGSLVFAGATSPYIHSYQWNDATGLGTLNASAYTGTTGQIGDFEINYNGTLISVSFVNVNTSSPGIFAYSDGSGITNGTPRFSGYTQLGGTSGTPYSYSSKFSKDGNAYAFHYAATGVAHGGRVFGIDSSGASTGLGGTLGAVIFTGTDISPNSQDLIFFSGSPLQYAYPLTTVAGGTPSVGSAYSSVALTAAMTAYGGGRFNNFG